MIRSKIIANRILKIAFFFKQITKNPLPHRKKVTNYRLVLLYTFECVLEDGWEDPEVHKDPEDAHKKALKKDVDIINYNSTIKSSSLS